MDSNIPAGYDENGVRNGVGKWTDYKDKEWEELGRTMAQAEIELGNKLRSINKAFAKGYKERSLEIALEDGILNIADLETIKKQSSNLDMQEE